MTRPYVVRPGDYLEKIAAKVGHPSSVIWEHPDNAALRARRTPNVLAPGDVVRVPKKPPPPAPLQRGASNRYVAEVPTTTVVLSLRRDGKPLANERYFVERGASRQSGTSDSEGKVTLTVSVQASEVLLLLPDQGTITPLQIGYLDPVDDVAGQRSRLANLGYFGVIHAFVARFGRPDKVGTNHDSQAALTSALRAFQRAKRLPVTGIADAATREALALAHGS